MTEHYALIISLVHNIPNDRFTSLEADVPNEYVLDSLTSKAKLVVA